MAFVTHNNYRSGVNSMPIANARPKRISRQCALDGFNARIKAELAGNVPAVPPLYSHSATRQSYYSQGWHSVTYLHVLKAKEKAREQRKTQAIEVPNEQ